MVFRYLTLEKLLVLSTFMSEWMNETSPLNCWAPLFLSTFTQSGPLASSLCTFLPPALLSGPQICLALFYSGPLHILLLFPGMISVYISTPGELERTVLALALTAYTQGNFLPHLYEFLSFIYYSILFFCFMVPIAVSNYAFFGNIIGSILIAITKL